jgi:hypothetical protein
VAPCPDSGGEGDQREGEFELEGRLGGFVMEQFHADPRSPETAPCGFAAIPD